MITATVFAIFYVPLFFVVVTSFFPKKPDEDSEESQPAATGKH